jgi:hypothetical protein
MIRLRIVHAIFVMMLFLVAGPARGGTRTQNFDTDPGWDGRNNRIRPTNPPEVNQDFGYDRSRRAIGGEFCQTIRPAWYGKPVGHKSLEDGLSASGSVAVIASASGTGWQNSANVFVGWFDPDPRSLIWRPRNFVGFRLQSAHDPDGALVEISYGTSEWQAGGTFVNKLGGDQEKLVRELKDEDLLRIPPDGSKHEWSVRYDPQGGEGAGEIVFVFNGKESRHRLQRHLRKIGASFTHFGIFTPRIPGRRIIAYFDDITIDGQPHDFSADPKWEGSGSRQRYRDADQYAYNQFGYSGNTNHAGGAKPGELGGRFMSCDPHENEFKAYYGDRIGKLTFNDRLVARGKFAPKEHCIDATCALGWFNSQEQGWPIRNFVGVYFDSLSDAGRIAQPLYGTSQGNKDRSGGWVPFVPDGTKYDWTLEYDPQAAGGRGAITFTLGDKSVTTPLAEGEKAKGAVFDRFGMFNMQWANSKWCDVYIDDVTYTVGDGNVSRASSP